VTKGSLGQGFQLDALVATLRDLHEALLLASPSGRILGANIAAADALEASMGTLVGSSLTDYAIDPARLRDRLEGALTPAPFSLRARDGRRFVCDANRVAPGLVLLRLSGGPDASERTRVLAEAMGHVGADDRGDSRLERLLAFTRLLARALTPAEVTEAVVDMGLAATSARAGGLWLRSADGATVCLARAVGAGVPRPEDFVHVPLDRPARMPILDVISEERPVWIESCARMAERYPHTFRAFFRAEDEESLACVPLFAQGRCIGGLSYRFEGVRSFAEDERAFLQVLAWHSAQAIERSRSYSAEKRAREAAESSQRRSEFLAHASTLLSSSLDELATLAAVARAAVPRIAEWCIVEASDEEQLPRLLVVEHSDPAKVRLVLEVHRRLRALRDPGCGLSTVLQSGLPELKSTISPDRLHALGDPELARLLGEIGVASSLVVPLAARGRILGLAVLVSARRPYGEDDLAMAAELGRRAGLALDNARLYREARDAERQKDEFLAMLSHELRNPLAPIVTALNAMTLTGSPAFAKERAVIGRHVHSVVRLVDDLLDVARITRGKIQLRMVPIEVSQVVAKSAEMLRPLVDARGQHLTITVPPQGLRILADEARLVQAIANLLSNANKYTPAGGAIAVSARAIGSEVIITVQDSGVGIAPEALPRIFDLFMQESPALDRARGGLGVGLTVVKELIGLHGGSVSAESEGVGRGSCFIIRLPLAPVEAEAPEPSSGQAKGEMTAIVVGLRVLLVDDNADAADMLGAALRAIGCVVQVVYDGPSALSAAASFQPDVALVDIGLPGMDGYAVGGRLRELYGVGSMRLVALTGYGHERDVLQSHEAGFDEHLVKPVDFEEIENVLRRAGRRHTQRLH
jgi:signal transduction histidine kinase/CheY-like chemotaxis protein